MARALVVWQGRISCLSRVAARREGRGAGGGGKNTTGAAFYL